MLFSWSPLTNAQVSSIIPRAKKRLEQIHAITKIDDLRMPPSNRLEKLSGDRENQWSIRINDQWRICFIWLDDHAWDVEIVDYH
ncbi:toxin HigB-1 [Gammaproteobacteria bacterium]